MKLLTTAQLKDWENYTCRKEGISSLELIQRIAEVCYVSIKNRLKNNPINFKEIVVCCGNGNNGKTGISMARLLSNDKIPVKVLSISEGTLTAQHFSTLSAFNGHTLVLDCIYDMELNNPAEEEIANLIKHINASQYFVISIDTPSGLPGEYTNEINLTDSSIVKANLTLTFQQPKRSFLFPESGEFTGDIEIIDIGLDKEYINEMMCDQEYVTAEDIRMLIKPRKKFSHKGSFGHVLMIAGSYGKMGAAVLACKAALKAGCGMVTCYIPKAGYYVIQTALPEAMVITDAEQEYITSLPQTENYDAIGTGPGIGTKESSVNALYKWLPTVNKPIVIDADALNGISTILNSGKKISIPVNAILTPHVKEFDRLAGESKSPHQRFLKQIQFAKDHNCIVILKGAYTATALPNGKIFFNSSGNPLLATAGSGDTLTGIITSLLAQGYAAEHAAVLGVYIHGVCADVKARKNHATMLASEIAEELPAVLFSLHT